MGEELGCLNRYSYHKSILVGVSTAERLLQTLITFF